MGVAGNANQVIENYIAGTGYGLMIIGSNAQVFGISVDTFFTLKAFRDHEKLTFPLLSDFNKQAIREYGVFNEDLIGLKGIAKRAVFVLDKDGVVRHREVLDDARNEPDYQKVFSALAALA